VCLNKLPACTRTVLLNEPFVAFVSEAPEGGGVKCTGKRPEWEWRNSINQPPKSHGLIFMDCFIAFALKMRKVMF